MKNLHILPTDKPSKLYEFGNELILQSECKEAFRNKNIYITSAEIPKLDEWAINTKNNVVYKDKGFTPTSYEEAYCRKIILTTDQDLINDGVQVIDDEFLEFFVNNPSCEWVEVDLVPVNEFGSEVTVNSYGFEKFVYKIILPKEEPKLIKCYCGHTSYCDCIPLEPKQETREEKIEKQIMGIDVDTGYRVPLKDLNLKQETLEEAAERRYGTDMDSIRGSNVYDLNTDLKRGFIVGAKWQQEKMYSEKQFEDMITTVFEMTNKGYSLKQILTKLKEQ